MPEENYSAIDVVFDMAIVQGVRNSPEQEEGEEPNSEIQYTGGSIDLLASKALVNLFSEERHFMALVVITNLTLRSLLWS